MSEVDKRFEPEYGFCGIDESVELRSGKLTLSLNDKKEETSATAFIDFLPDPRVKFRSTVKGVYGIGPSPVVTFDGVQIEGFVAHWKLSGNLGTSEIIWVPSTEPILVLGDENTSSAWLKFHLFNFCASDPSSSIHQSSIADGSFRIDQILLRGGGYTIEIRSLASTQNVQKSLKESGGCGLTHVAIIERENGRDIDGVEIDQLSRVLRDFLTFANGNFCNPDCLVGYNIDDEIVWEGWSSPTSNYQSDLSWYDGKHSDMLERLFGGFFQRYITSGWCDAIHTAIYWYARSNNSKNGIDSGIILTQTALELLSFEYAVNEKGLVSADGFGRLSAADKLRLLFAALDIPMAIPKESKKVHSLARELNWVDAPQAITAIRNRLVHPKRKAGHADFSNAFYETWNMSLWFLELVILRLCRFDGEYGNRLTQCWLGEMEKVPWSQTLNS